MEPRSPVLQVDSVSSQLLGKGKIQVISFFLSQYIYSIQIYSWKYSQCFSYSVSQNTTSKIANEQFNFRNIVYVIQTAGCLGDSARIPFPGDSFYYILYSTEQIASVLQTESQRVKSENLCLTLCNPMDCTVHGILQARILEWVAFPFSRKSKVRFKFDIKFMPHHKQKHMETRKLKILLSPAMMFSISSHTHTQKILKSTSIGLFNLVMLNFSLLLFNFSFNLLLEFRT